MTAPSAKALNQKVHELADSLPEGATWGDVAYQAVVRAEAEVRAILQHAPQAAGSFRLGSALAAIGDKHGGIDLEPMSRDEAIRIAEFP